MRESIESSTSNAFVVILADEGAVIPPHVRRFADQRVPPGLHFDPTTHHTWASADGTTLLAAWERVGVSGGTRWWEAGIDRRVAFLAGHYRPYEAPWPLDDMTGRFMREAFRGSISRAIDDAEGAFTVASFDDHGGFVACDALGFGFLYQSRGMGFAAFGSRAELVAWATTREHGRPAKDPLTPCWTVFAPSGVGDRTGFEDVRLLPERAIVSTRAGGRVTIESGGAAWLNEGVDRADDVFECITDAVGDSLEAALALPSRTHDVDLTGGKDSRLVLAVALRRGLADDFTFRTVGPPDLQDVEVAASLAKQIGVRHESGVMRSSSNQPYLDRTIRFVRATHGTVSIRDQTAPLASPARVRLSGKSGECLRSHLKVWPPPDDTEAIVELVRRRYGRGRLSLLQPDVEDRLADLLVAEIGDPELRAVQPLDRLGTFLVRSLSRHYRGPMDELESDFRISPLVSLRTVRAAYQLPGELRQDESVHRTIMQRADPLLAAHPFAGPGWPPPRRKGATRPGGRRRTALERAKPPRVKSESLMKRGARMHLDEHREFLADMFADATNPAWDVLQRSRAIDAARRLEELDRAERRQVYGAATVAIWMGS